MSKRKVHYTAECKQDAVGRGTKGRPPRLSAFFRLHLPFVPETSMKSLLLLLAITLTASAQTEKPLASFPYTPGLDLTSMDKTADPCVDFYQYSCGGWKKNNPIPADRARWSVYGKLSQDNQQFLWGILYQLSRQASGRNANQQKIGDYFGACMDEAAVNQLGARPLRPYLDQIAAMQSTKDLPALLAGLHTSLETRG